MIQRLFSFVTLACFLLTLIGLPKHLSDPLRSTAVASFAPAWYLASRFKAYLQDRPLFRSSSAQSQPHLEIELQALKSELEIQLSWKEWMEHLKWESGLLQQLKSDANQPFFERRYEEMSDLARRQFFAILAPVIYRDPSSWSSSLWIQVGQKDNETLGRTIVAKNSPVVLGSSLIGVVEFVGRHQSRVRLITDSGLTISVRAARGKLQDRHLFDLISSLQDRLDPRNDLFVNDEQKQVVLKTLQQVQTRLSSEDRYGAKGQLQGSSAPFWRSRSLILQGIGFNYDYPDLEGSARELKTGRPIGASGSELALLRPGDTLLTSGLDGVFPPGIQVAIVTKVSPLLEGAYGYEIQACPTAMHLNDLQTVFVLPPLTLEE